MKRKYTLMGIGLVILALLALIIYPSAPNLEKYTRLYEQGLYTEVITELMGELKHNPDWWEGRELLAHTALAQGRLDLALVQLGELKAADWDVLPLEYKFNSWLRDNLIDSEYAGAAIVAARSCAENASSWDWSGEFYLQLLVKLERAAEMPEALELFVATHSPDSPVEPYMPDLYSLVVSAWELLAEASDSQALWQISVLMEEKMPRRTWRQMAAWEIEPDDLEHLQGEYPQDSMLALALANSMPPQDGLAFMRDWEQKYSVQAEDELLYSSIKSLVLRGADTLESQDLNWLNPDQLFQVALESVAQPGKCQVILERLEEEGSFSEQVDLIRTALAGPKPRLILQGTNPVISPDGEWLVAWKDLWVLYNLDTGREIPLDSELADIAWVWAPDSGKVAGADWTAPGSIQIYDTQGQITQLELGDEHYMPVGWYNTNTLWIQPVITEPVRFIEAYQLNWQGQPLLCNLETSEVYAYEDMQKSEVQLFAGPDGSLAWQRLGDGPCMLRKGELFELTSQSMDILGWVPDGSGLLLNRNGALSQWSGGEPQTLGVKGWFLGWKNQAEFYWSAPLHDHAFLQITSVVHPLYMLPWVAPHGINRLDGPGVLMAYNLKTGKTKELGILGNFTAAAGNTVVLDLSGAAHVYKLP